MYCNSKYCNNFLLRVTCCDNIMLLALQRFLQLVRLFYFHTWVIVTSGFNPGDSILPSPLFQIWWRISCPSVSLSLCPVCSCLPPRTVSFPHWRREEQKKEKKREKKSSTSVPPKSLPIVVSHHVAHPPVSVRSFSGPVGSPLTVPAQWLEHTAADSRPLKTVIGSEPRASRWLPSHCGRRRGLPPVWRL